MTTTSATSPQTSTTAKKLTVHKVLEQIKAEGARYIFGSSAAADSPITAALLKSSDHKDKSLSFVGGLGELSAIFMASGYAQATGLPAVMNISAGQAALKILPAVYAASRDQVPLVILADQEDSHILNDESMLVTDFTSFMRPVAKWTAEANTAKEVCRLIRRAFHEAFSAPKGPVVLSLPLNLLLSTAAADITVPPVLSPLAGADDSFIQKVAKELMECSSPVIVAGNEVSQYKARNEVVMLAETIGCPVYCESLPVGVNFPNRHPQFAGVLPLNGQEACQKLKHHDVFLLLGVQTRLPSRQEEPSLVPDHGMVIQINMDPHLGGKTIRSNMSATANIAESLAKLRADIQLSADKNWLNNANARANKTVKDIQEERTQKDEMLIYSGPDDACSLNWLLKLLDGVRPPKSIVVSDLVNKDVKPFELVGFESGSSYFSTTSGVSGWAAGASLGINWASGDIPVVCLTSDESLLENLHALWTAAHYKLNLKFVVCKSSGVANLNLQPSAPARKPPRWKFSNPEIDLVNIAKGYGVPGTKVERFNYLELEMAKMFAFDGPTICEISLNVDEINQS